MAHKHKWQYNDVIYPTNHRACECGAVEHVQVDGKWVKCEHMAAVDVLDA